MCKQSMQASLVLLRTTPQQLACSHAEINKLERAHQDGLVLHDFPQAIAAGPLLSGCDT